MSAGIESGFTSRVKEMVSCTFLGVGVAADSDEVAEAVDEVEVLDLESPTSVDESASCASESFFPDPPKKPFSLSVIQLFCEQVT